MNLSETIAALRAGLTFAQKAAPIAQALGVQIPGNAAQVLAASAEIAQAALKAIDAGRVAINSRDEVELRELLEEIQQENDALAARVAAMRKT